MAPLLIYLIKGVVVGLLIAVPVGPVGVLCVRRTIFEGRLFGLVSGLGAASADTVFGIIAGFGLTVVSDWLLGWQTWLRAGGGLFLVWIGVRALTRHMAETKHVEHNTENFLRAYGTSRPPARSAAGSVSISPSAKTASSSRARDGRRRPAAP